MTRSQELQRDIQWLRTHPDGDLCSSYHDAGSCWELINALRRELTDCEAKVVAYRQSEDDSDV